MEISAPRCALMCYPSSNITYCIACLLCIGVILLNKFNSIQFKTKSMVFARSKTRLNIIPTFKFGNIDLEQVEDYIYLGICFNWNGSFVKAKKLLHDKASKAMYSLIQKGRRLYLPTDIMLKLFDSCV